MMVGYPSTCWIFERGLSTTKEGPRPKTRGKEAPSTVNISLILPLACKVTYSALDKNMMPMPALRAVDV